MYLHIAPKSPLYIAKNKQKNDMPEILSPFNWTESEGTVNISSDHI